MKKLYPFLFFTACFIACPPFSYSQPGTLDASFGIGGRVVTQVGDSSSVANAVVVTAEGKIVVGGYQILSFGAQTAVLLQYKSDGSIDSAFGTNGNATLPILYESSISSLTLQPDGKILAAGFRGFANGSNSAAEGFLVARFNKNGTLDSTFGENGIAPEFQHSNGYPPIADATKIAVKPDGKIVAGGAIYFLNFSSIPALAQYLPDGTFDSSFGSDGLSTSGTDFAAAPAGGISDFGVTADNKIVSLFYKQSSFSGSSDFFLAKFLSNGDYDSTFGDNAMVRTDISNGSDDLAQSVVVLADNSFIVAGGSYKGNPDYVSFISLVKYRSNGSPDSSFGISGKVQTVLPGSVTPFVKHIFPSLDGSVFVSGFLYNSTRDFLLLKYHSNGTLDSSFGFNGISVADFSSASDISYSSALQSDGKIILAGSTGNNTDYDVALTRYNNSTVYPLHLLSFTATGNTSGNLLQWQTNTEMNTNGFQVERSGDGKSYTAIGFVNVGNVTYRFTDEASVAGSNYYRLKIIDKDGSFVYSPVRIINNDRAFTVKLYPNPAKNNLQLQIAGDEDKVLRWQIVSADGRVLMLNQWQAQPGNSYKSINIARLAKGNYYLVMIDSSHRKTVVKFEKL